MSWIPDHAVNPPVGKTGTGITPEIGETGRNRSRAAQAKWTPECRYAAGALPHTCVVDLLVIAEKREAARTRLRPFRSLLR